MCVYVDVCACVYMCTAAGKWLLTFLLALCGAPGVTCSIKRIRVGCHGCDKEPVRVILMKHQSCLAYKRVAQGDTLHEATK